MPFDWEDRARGGQFHPEYRAGIMRSYIEEQREELESEGRDVSELSHAVEETPFAVEALGSFARLVEGRADHRP